MGKRIEMDLTEKEYLIQECLAGRMRMREAARRAGVGHSTMHNWISRYRAEPDMDVPGGPQTRSIWRKMC